MKQTRIIDGSPIAFKALLLTLTLFAAGVLLFCNSLTPLDRTWLLSAILVSAAAFFVLSFEKKVEYVKRVDIISIPDNKEEAQAKEGNDRKEGGDCPDRSKSECGTRRGKSNRTTCRGGKGE